MKRPIVMAEFASGPELLGGVRALGASGVSRLEAFTPYRVDGLAELLGLRRSRLPWILVAAGLVGGGSAYLLQRWIQVLDLPLELGDGARATTVMLPITYEVAVLLAAAAGVIAALVLAGLPRLWNPVFEIAGFERATRDRFWLAVAPGDPALDPERDNAALEAAGALRIVWLASAASSGAAAAPRPRIRRRRARRA